MALALFSLAFPCGAALAEAVAARARDGTGDARGDGERVLSVMRVVMSAFFVYMAFELAPPHSHRRLLNCAHGCMFALGIGVSSAAELVERLTTE